MYNSVKVKSKLPVMLLLVVFSQIVNSELNSRDPIDKTNGKLVVIKNETYVGENINKTHFVAVSGHNFEQQAEDFSQYEDFSPEFDSLGQVQELESFPISSPEFQNGSITTSSYTFYSNSSSSGPLRVQYEHTQNYELVKAEQNVDSLTFLEHYYYRSVFIGNFDYFSEHWDGIFTGEPSGYGAVEVKLSFSFLFYGRYINDIKINSKGFIEIGQHYQNKDVPTQYIAPLMANFDVLTTQDSITYYDDGQKFTVFWENVHLEGDEDNLFIFGLTLYRNGDIVFAYKNVPFSLIYISEKDNNFKIGISDTYVEDKVFNSNHQLIFNNYDIVSNSMLWLSILPSIPNTITQETDTATALNKKIEITTKTSENEFKKQEEPSPVSSSQVGVDGSSDTEYQQPTGEWQENFGKTTSSSISSQQNTYNISIYESAPEKNSRDTFSDTISTLSNNDQFTYDAPLKTHEFTSNEPGTTESLSKTQITMIPEEYINLSTLSEDIRLSQTNQNFEFYASTVNPLLELTQQTVTVTTESIQSVPEDLNQPNYVQDKQSLSQDPEYTTLSSLSDFTQQNSTISTEIIQNTSDEHNFHESFQEISYTTEFDHTTMNTSKLVDEGLKENIDQTFNEAVAKEEIPYTTEFYPMTTTDFKLSDEVLKENDKQTLNNTAVNENINILQGSVEETHEKINYMEKNKPTSQNFTPTTQTFSIEKDKSEPFIDNVQAFDTKDDKLSEKYITHNFYKSVFVNDNIYFNEHWTEITKSEPLPEARRRGTRRHVTLPFEFPFYGHTIRSIVVTRQGFIDTSDHTHRETDITQYIAPLKTIFNKKANGHSALKLYPDDEKFTALWENFELENDRDKKFTFAVTLYKNGDIVFAYKDMSSTIQEIVKTSNNTIKVGISDTYLTNNPVREISFLNYDITGGVFIKLVVLPPVADNKLETTNEENIKPDSDNSNFNQESEISANNSLNKERTDFLSSAVRNSTSNFSPLADKIGTITLQNTTKNGLDISTESYKELGTVEADSYNFLPIVTGEKIEETSKYTEHESYKSILINDKKYFTDHWAEITNTAPLAEIRRRSSRRRVKLAFDFPFYNRVVRNISVSRTHGFIDTSDTPHREALINQYIAPFMSNFNRKPNNNMLKLYEDENKFTALWEDAELESDTDKKLTFSVTLYKNGDIIFAYKNFPISLAVTDFSNIIIKIGIGDIDRSEIKSRQISFINYTINSGSLIKMVLLRPTLENVNEKLNFTSAKETILGTVENNSTFLQQQLTDKVKTHTSFDSINVTKQREETLDYVVHNFYKSTHIKNAEFFNNYWTKITKEEPLIEIKRRSSRRRMQLNFDFPFYDRVLRNISVSISRGYIDTSDNSQKESLRTEYIAPFMANFNRRPINKVLKLYQDEDKFTAIWEDVELENYIGKQFTFAATLYKEGDIIFAYKNIPISIREINEDENPVVVGIHHTTDSISQEVTFLNYDITSGSVIKVIPLHFSSDPFINEEEKIQIINKPLEIKQSHELTMHASDTTGIDYTTESKIANESTYQKESIVPPITKSPEISQDSVEKKGTKDTPVKDDSVNKLIISPYLDLIEYSTHGFYKSAFIEDQLYFDDYWTNVTKSLPLKETRRRSSRRRVTLSFEFPFYGHVLRNVSITKRGFLDTRDHIQRDTLTTQYIAPLMSNFDLKVSIYDTVKLYDDGNQFTAIWNKVKLEDDNENDFTFAATLYKNGDIIFAYKNMPITLQQIKERGHQAKVGISDTYLTNNSQRQISFANYNISSNTVIRMIVSPPVIEESPETKYTGSPVTIKFEPVTEETSVDGSSIQFSELDIKNTTIKQSNISFEVQQNFDDDLTTVSTTAHMSDMTIEHEIYKHEHENNSLQGSYLITPAENIDNNKYVIFNQYKIMFIKNLKIYNDYWNSIIQSKKISETKVTNLAHGEKLVTLTFDFPFLGQVIRNVSVYSEGYLDLMNYEIRPFKLNFTQNPNLMEMYDDDGKFTVLWRELKLENSDKADTFTLSVTLNKNGDLIFAYENIPLSFTELKDAGYEVKIGTKSGDNIISIKNYAIESKTMLMLVPSSKEEDIMPLSNDFLVFDERESLETTENVVPEAASMKDYISTLIDNSQNTEKVINERTTTPYFGTDILEPITTSASPELIDFTSEISKVQSNENNQQLHVQDLTSEEYMTDKFYKIVLINNDVYFNNYWINITNSMHLKDTGRRQSHHHNRIVRLSFDFPFHGHFISNITVSNDGFIATGDLEDKNHNTHKFIAPLMTKFTKNPSAQNIIKIYDDGEKFTVLWYNVELERHEEDRFTFAVTLCKNGNIVFAYKDMPLTLKRILKLYDSTHVGISDNYGKDSYSISFLNYNIISGSLIEFTALEFLTDRKTENLEYDANQEVITKHHIHKSSENHTLLNATIQDASPLSNNIKNNSEYGGNTETQTTTDQSIYDETVGVTISYGNSDSAEETQTEHFKLTETSHFDNNNATSSPQDTKQLTFINHSYYKSTLTSNPDFFQDYWSNILHSKPRKNLHKTSDVFDVELPFEFPFYNRVIRNIAVSEKGIIDIGTNKYDKSRKMQYIAPLMSNFYYKRNPENSLSFFEDGEKFSIIWEDVMLENSNDEQFTFAATLFNNGDIIFAYKNLPLLIPEISDAGYEVVIGLSSINPVTNELQIISFKDYAINNATILKIIPQEQLYTKENLDNEDDFSLEEMSKLTTTDKTSIDYSPTEYSTFSYNNQYTLSPFTDTHEITVQGTTISDTWFTSTTLPDTKMNITQAVTHEPSAVGNISADNTSITIYHTSLEDDSSYIFNVSNIARDATTAEYSIIEDYSTLSTHSPFYINSTGMFPEGQEFTEEVTTESAMLLLKNNSEVFEEGEKDYNIENELANTQTSTINILSSNSLDIKKNKEFSMEIQTETKIIAPQQNIEDLIYVNHNSYNSVFIGNLTYFNNHWEEITKSKLRRPGRRNQHRTNKPIKLPFEFPFYDRTVRNIRIADGFVDLSGEVSIAENTSYYIAPLMSNFENKLQGENAVKNYEEDDKYTTVWDGVTIDNKKFTFAVTLYKNGDIVFAYKNVPIPIQDVFKLYEKTIIGISDGVDETHQILFKYYDIKDNTVLKLLAVNNLLTSSTQLPTTSTPIAISTISTTKLEPIHRKLGTNKSKYSTTTGNIIDEISIVTESATKLNNEHQEVTETKPKIPSSRRKTPGIRRKPAEEVSVASKVINKENESSKVLNHSQSVIKSEVVTENEVHSLLLEKPDRLENENVQNYTSHRFYRSLLTNDLAQFEDHWNDIIKQKPLKLQGRSNSRRTDINQTLTFGFPFYGRKIFSVVVTTEGFLSIGESSNGLQSTQYIAPLMTNLDKKSIRQNSIKLYDDGEKFTALWENVRLQSDRSKTFTFAVTIYKNGDIVFAYKDLPISIKMISGIEPLTNIGVSDIVKDDENFSEEIRKISFMTYEITETSLLKLKIDPSCELHECITNDSIKPEINEQPSTNSITLSEAINYDVETSSNIDKTKPTLLQNKTKLDTIQSSLNKPDIDSKIITIDIQPINDDTQQVKNNGKGAEIIDQESKITRPLVKIPGLTGKITGNKFKKPQSSIKSNITETIAVKSDTKIQMIATSKTDDHPITPVLINQTKLDKMQNLSLIHTETELETLNYVNHGIYKSVFIINTEYFNEHWKSLKKSKPLKEAGRSNTRRNDKLVQLNFDFPFYTHTIKDIIITNEGYIATSDRSDQSLASGSLRIAPLMLNFTNKANSQSSIKLYNDVDKFTAIWENLYLLEDKNNKFTFAATLYKNGNIIFAYKNIPISITEIISRGYKIEIGIKDESIEEGTFDEHNYVSLLSYEISSNTLIKIETLQNNDVGNVSISDKDVESDFFDVLTTQDPLTKTSEVPNVVESIMPITHKTNDSKENIASVIDSKPLVSDMKNNNVKGHVRPIRIKAKDTLDLTRPTSISSDFANITTFSQSNDKISDFDKTTIKQTVLNNVTDSVITTSDVENNVNNNFEDKLTKNVAQVDVNNLSYLSHQLYKSVFIKNTEYFKNHWESIMKSKQIKQAGRGNTRRNDINAKIAFGFPFHNQTIRNIKISINGFVDTGAQVSKDLPMTWYVSPLMTNFDNKTNSNSIKLYQDSEKFTVIWENLNLIQDNHKSFTFAVTFYKSGDIIFAYKDIPTTLAAITNEEYPVKVGILYTPSEGNDLVDDNRVVLFEDYDISSETLLKLIAITTCQKGNNCNEPQQESIAEDTLQNTTETTISKKNGFSRGRYIVDDASKNVDKSYENLNNNIETVSNTKTKTNPLDSRRKLGTLKSNTLLASEDKPPPSETDKPITAEITSSTVASTINTKPIFSGARRKVVGARTKTTTETPDISIEDDAQKQIIVQSQTVPVSAIGSEISALSEIVSGNISKETQEGTKLDKDMEIISYINHGLYKSAFVENQQYFEEHWKEITNSKLIRQAGRGNSRRSDTVVKLTFDFLYFGHIIRNIIVTNEGLINIGDTLQHGRAYSQYIAPLRAPFDNKSTSKSTIKLYDDGEKFTALWENVYLQTDKINTFTFAATLYKNGNIVFAYKDMPIPFETIQGKEHQVQIGIYDQSTETLENYRDISFNSYKISNKTLLKLISLEACQLDNSCDSLDENSSTTIPVTSVETIEPTTKATPVIRRPNLLQRKSSTITSQTTEDTLSDITKAPEDISQILESVSTVAPNKETSIKSKLISSRRKIGGFKSSSNKTVIENQVLNEDNRTKLQTEIHNATKESPDFVIDTTTSPELLESSTKINPLRRRILNRKEKNTSNGNKSSKNSLTNANLALSSVENDTEVITLVTSKENQSAVSVNGSESDLNTNFKSNLDAGSEMKELVEAELSSSNLHYVSHGYYRTAFFSEPLYFSEHWSTITRGKPLRQPGRSNTRRNNISKKISFDFPYHGKNIGNIIVTNQGSIVFGDNNDGSNAFTSSQYIAPLMLNFDSKASSQSSIKLYEDNEKFTVVWEKLALPDDRLKTFTFAVTLYENGEIMFAYKDFPISIQSLSSKNEIKVGLKDSNSDNEGFGEISYLSYNIINSSIIKIIVDSSNQQVTKDDVTKINLQDEHVTLEADTTHTNIENSSQSDHDDHIKDQLNISSSRPEELVPSPANNIKDNVNRSSTKNIANRRKPLSSRSKIPYNKLKTSNSTNNEEGLVEELMPTTTEKNSKGDPSISADIERQESEKDVLDEVKEESRRTTTARPKLIYRPSKTIGNNGKSFNGIKFRKIGVKSEATSSTVLTETKNYENIVQGSNEDITKQRTTYSESQPQNQIQLDTQEDEPEEEIEAQTLASIEQVTPTLAPSIKLPDSGLRRKSIVTTAGVNRQVLKTKPIDSLSEDASKTKEHQPRSKGRKNQSTISTQIIHTQTESQDQNSESLREKEISQFSAVVNSAVQDKASNSKYTTNSLRRRLIGKSEESKQKESINKQIETITFNGTTNLDVDKKSAAENLTVFKPNEEEETIALVQAQTDISSLNYVYHGSYKTTFFKDLEYFNRHWEDIINASLLTPDTENNFAKVKLSFDFPFYGRFIRDVAVTRMGFIDLSGSYDGAESTSYIAPLMGNFNSNDWNSVKIFDDTSKFTVLWENLYHKQFENESFTFALTLFRSGDIVFAYKILPLSIYEIAPEVHVGIKYSDETSTGNGKELNPISFTRYDITSESILKLIKTDNNTEGSEEIVTSSPLPTKSSRLTVKNIGKNKTFKFTKTTSVDKNSEKPTSENVSQITTRRKITDRRYQSFSTTPKTVVSEETETGSLDDKHESSKLEVTASQDLPEILESSGKTEEDSSHIYVEKIPTITSHRIMTTKKFQKVSSINKSTLTNDKSGPNAAPITADIQIIKSETVSSDATPVVSESIVKPDSETLLTGVQDTSNVASRRKIFGKRFRTTSDSTKTTYLTKNESKIDPSSERPESIKLISPNAAPEPVLNTEDQSSAIFVEKTVKTSGGRRISSRNYQALGGASKFVSSNTQAKLEFPTLQNGHEIVETEGLITEVPATIEESVRTAKKSDEIVAEDAVAISTSEQDDNINEARPDPIRRRTLSRRSKSRQKVILQQTS